MSVSGFVKPKVDKSLLQNGPYPVMVLVHGGGFAFGSAMYYRDYQDIAENFVSKGIVVVAIQYRLGVYGMFRRPQNGASFTQLF